MQKVNKSKYENSLTNATLLTPDNNITDCLAPSDVVYIISNAMHIPGNSITNIYNIKKGMTNQSFLFRHNDNSYLLRIPGIGTDYLINRFHESIVYHTIANKGLCDDPIYLNPETGYKITKFLANARVCDPNNEHDITMCMSILRHFHKMNLHVPHTFDPFDQINFYESLWNNRCSLYPDYLKTKENIFSLKKYIDYCNPPQVLSHIDAVPDNFLIYEKDGKEYVQLTDWEYSGMQDPHIDIAMFCIYSMYDQVQIDHLIDIYFDGTYDISLKAKIYCYISICGLLWSNWCEYKHSLGVEFGEYSYRQYQYAKEYYTIATKLIERSHYV